MNVEGPQHWGPQHGATARAEARHLTVRSVLAICAVPLLAALLFVTAPGIAHADAQPEVTAPVSPGSDGVDPTIVKPTPTPTPPAPPQHAVKPAVTIETPASGTFLRTGATSVSGTATAEHHLQVLSSEGGEPFCETDVSASGQWSCTVDLPDGQLTLKAVLLDGSGGSNVTSEPVTVGVLSPPVVTGGDGDSGVSDGRVRGTAYPNASVTVESAGSTCTTTAGPSGDWICALGGLPSGTHSVTATQQTDFSAPASSDASAALSVNFDTESPSAPSITSPISGAYVSIDGATYSGTGEEGSTVTVFAGSYSVCSVVVTGGVWTCTAGGVAAGAYHVVAVQQDAAGNTGPGSSPITVAYASASTPSPTPPKSDGADPNTAIPVPPVKPPADKPSASPPSATPTPPAPNGNHAAPAPPNQLQGGWSDPTQFTSAVIPPPWNAQFPWLQALLFAFAAVALLVIPARLLAGTLSRARGGRPFWGGRHLAGRNRAREEFETAPNVRLNRWLLGGAALMAAAGLVMLSGPVTDQPAYLRLLLAVVIALGIVNAVGMLLPLWWSTRVTHTAATASFLPRYLLLVGVAALGSRLFDVQPALLFGLLASVAVPAGTSVVNRGHVAAVRAASLIALAVIGWLVLTAVPEAAGFIGTIGAEVANTVVLAAIGSAVLILIPIGSTSGRSILNWSPLAWAGLTVLAFSILFVVMAPVAGGWPAEGALAWVVAGSFAAISVGAWTWQRFVAPALR